MSTPPGASTVSPPVAYMERTRRYYQALGYEVPYSWAHFDDVPFTPLSRPLASCRLALIGTARPLREPDDPSIALPPPRVVRSVPTDRDRRPERLYTQDLAWDHETTHTEDPGTYFPIDRLHELVEDGVIGSLAPRAHSVPTEYSQRKTTEEDAPEILRRCREDGAEVALLVPL
jgi:D-proline reductase (dithiol) PrdB